jgi:hypothetical protein
VVFRNFFAMVTAVALSVVAAFSFSMAAFSFTVTALSVSMMAASAFPMAALLIRKVFPMEPVLELLLGGVPDGNDLPLEIQDLACHGMVEVHGHGIVLDFDYRAFDHLVGAVQHRECPSDLEKIFADHPVNHEGILRDVELAFRVPIPVSVGRL